MSPRLTVPFLAHPRHSPVPLSLRLFPAHPHLPNPRTRYVSSPTSCRTSPLRNSPLPSSPPSQPHHPRCRPLRPQPRRPRERLPPLPSPHRNFSPRLGYVVDPRTRLADNFGLAVVSSGELGGVEAAGWVGGDGVRDGTDGSLSAGSGERDGGSASACCSCDSGLGGGFGSRCCAMGSSLSRARASEHRAVGRIARLTRSVGEARGEGGTCGQYCFGTSSGCEARKRAGRRRRVLISFGIGTHRERGFREAAKRGRSGCEGRLGLVCWFTGAPSAQRSLLYTRVIVSVFPRLIAHVEAEKLTELADSRSKGRASTDSDPLQLLCETAPTDPRPTYDNEVWWDLSCYLRGPAPVPTEP